MSLPTAKTDVTATTHMGDINLQLQDDSFVQLGINNMYNTAHNMQVGDTFNNAISTNTQNIDTMTVDTDSVFNNENPYIDQYE
jgi:DNA-directed RNA polymerase specialized sigma54-like protein